MVSVTSIGNGAFTNCSGLTSVTIPNSVTSIGQSAFSGCCGLTSVTIPNSVTSIGHETFSGCSNLTSVTWNAKACNYISDVDFDPPFYCLSNIMSFEFGNEVETIPEYLCDGLSGLTSVTIPNSVTSIGNKAFVGCSGLTSVTWNAKSCNDFKYSSVFSGLTNIKTFEFGNDVKKIPAYLCYGLSRLTSVTIPNSVTSIGEDAFNGCTSLRSVTIGNSVTEIGWSAFFGCSGLTGVYISDLAKWCEIAFDNDTANPLTNAKHLFVNGEEVIDLVIPNTVTRIDSYAFVTCVAFKSATIPNSVTSIGNYAFSGCSGLASVTIGNSVTSIGQSAFSGCRGLTSVTIPNSVTSIRNSAFYGCGLASIKVEDGNVAYDSRNNCHALIETATNTLLFGCKNTTIPNSVTSIGNYAFDECSDLTSVTIPNSVTSIGQGAFQDCTGLTSVTIPNSVTSIGGSAFLSCSGLTDIYSDIDVPSNVTMGANVFNKVPTSTCVLHVPVGTTALYRTAAQWNAFTNIVEPAIVITSISLDHSELSLTEGETASLTATVLPEDATDKGVTWSSSDESVATVENGVVTAVAAGTATITATTADGSNLSASCTVTVNPLIIIAESISLDRDEVTLTEGETATLTATMLPEDTTDKGVTWSSSDTSVATVENGVVTAVAAGTATITATTADGSELSASCAVTVNPLIIIAESISLDRDEVTLTEGETATLTATVLPEDATDKGVTWSSSDSSVATVDANGTVTAVAAGTATITATTTDGSDLSASCAVTVIAQQLVNELSVADYRCMAGDTFTIDVSLSNGNEIGGVQFDLYLPEGFSVALDSDGKPDITLDGNRSDGHQLMVNNDFADGHLNVLAFSMDNEAFVGNDGAVIHINVVAGNALAGGDYVLELRDIELAVPDGSDAYNYASLTSTITVMMMGDANADGRVTVSDVLIVARRANGYVVDGLNDAIIDMNGDGRITVSDLLIVANISNNGQAAASGAPMRRAPRRANELSADNHLAIADVTCDPGERFTLPVEMVNPDEIGGFMFDLYLPEGFTIGLNKKGKLDITLEQDRIEDHTLQFNNTFDDGHLHVQAFSMNNEPFYDNEGPVVYIAIVADGNVSAGIHTAAVHMIELSSPSRQENRQDDEGFTFNIIVAGEVTPTESITLDRNEVTLAEGETTTLTATVLPEDATDKGVSWSSSDESVATVDAAGTVTAVAAGTATITATTTDGSELSASCVVTVEAQQHSDGLSADNYLAIADVTCDPGERFTLPVEMVNPDEIGGFMFDLYLPEGFTIGLNKKGKLDITLEQDRIEDHTLQFNNSFDDGHLHVQAFSMSNEPFYGNEGPVVYIAIVADDNVSAGIHTAAVRMIELSSPSGMENRQDDEGFTFDINVAGGLTLAEVLSNGTDGSYYSISSTLAVVKKSEDNVHAYVTDGEGNWARLEGEAVAGLEEGAGVVGVAGTLSASGIAPTITLSAEPVLSTAVPYEIATIDLSRAFREMPMPCQVVTINGFFDGTKLRAYRAYPQGQGIAVDLGHSTADLEIGKKYIVTAAIELLEPWESDAPNGAPARIKTDDSNALDNLKAGILESQLDLETGIVDLAADDGDGVYYNLLGVPVQHPTPGIYIHNGKKVVVR